MIIDFSNVNEKLSAMYDYLTFSNIDSQDFALLPMPATTGPNAEEAKARADYTRKVAAAKAQFDAKMNKIREKRSSGLVKVTKSTVPVVGKVGAPIAMSESEFSDEDKPENTMVQDKDPDISDQQNIINDILAAVHEKLSGDEDKKYTKEVLKKLRNPTVLSAITKLQESGVSKDKIVDKYVNNVLTKINGVSEDQA